MVAHATGCWLRTDEDNVIHIEPVSVKKSENYAGIWSDNGHAPYSMSSLLDDRNTIANLTYGTLELNRWTLDDTQVRFYYPGTLYYTGYIGDACSNENGEYSINPIISKSFETPHDLRVLVLQFDSVLGEFALEIDVRYLIGSAIMAEKTGIKVSSGSVTVNCEEATNITSIEIEFKKSLPYRRSRLTKAYYRETDFILDNSSILEDGQQVTLIDKLKSVDVNVKRYEASESAETLFNEMVYGDYILIQFDYPVQVTEREVSVGNSTDPIINIYTRAIEISNMGETNHSITVMGTKISESDQKTSFPVSKDGEVDTEDNPLVTTQNMAQDLANRVKNYLTMRNTYDISYRGNPELEVGDEIAIQTKFSGQLDGLILTDEITFNGSISGKVKVKGLI